MVALAFALTFSIAVSMPGQAAFNAWISIEGTTQRNSTGGAESNAITDVQWPYKLGYFGSSDSGTIGSGEITFTFESDSDARQASSVVRRGGAVSSAEMTFSDASGADVTVIFQPIMLAIHACDFDYKSMAVRREACPVDSSTEFTLSFEGGTWSKSGGKRKTLIIRRSTQ